MLVVVCSALQPASRVDLAQVPSLRALAAGARTLRVLQSHGGAAMLTDGGRIEMVDARAPGPAAAALSLLDELFLLHVAAGRAACELRVGAARAGACADALRARGFVEEANPEASTPGARPRATFVFDEHAGLRALTRAAVAGDARGGGLASAPVALLDALARLPLAPLRVSRARRRCGFAVDEGALTTPDGRTRSVALVRDVLTRYECATLVSATPLLSPP